MTQILRQSTQIIVRIGPAVAVGDGFTPVVTLDLSTADEAELLKANTTTTTSIAAATFAAITGCDGWYGLTLTTTHTDTVGPLDIMVNDDSLILPIFARFQVIEEATYDMIYAASALGYIANAPVNVAQFGGSNGTFASGRAEVNLSHIAGSAVSTTTAQLGVNMVQISGDGTAADNLETAFDDTAGAVRWMGIVDQGTAQSATDTTLVLRAAAAFANDEIVGATIVITGGTTGVGQARTITDYDLATDTATVATWTTTPTGTITYKIYGTAASQANTDITAIKAKTDQLTFTVANQVDANAESMNAVTIIGAGTSGDLWRA